MPTDYENCPACKDHTNSIKRNARDIEKIWREINQMKWFVISGMVAVVVQLVLVIIERV